MTETYQSMKKFEDELKIWMKKRLNPYCLNKCKQSCCDCEGSVQIDYGYKHLFEKFRSTGKKVPIKPQKFKGPHLFKEKRTGLWFFEGGACPNYDPKNKLCLIHNKYPRCTLFPLLKIKQGYMIFTTCALHQMNPDKEPLKSLIALCRKHKINLYAEDFL